jgi:transposase-like protein
VKPAKRSQATILIVDDNESLLIGPTSSRHFDQVATLSVEGLNKSAIARVQRIAWNTVDRWLEKAGDCFNDQKTTGAYARLSSSFLMPPVSRS